MTCGCDVCGFESARIRRMPRSYGSGDDLRSVKDQRLLVIEQVPVVSCPNCGSSYLTAQTMQAIDQIKQHRSDRSQSRPMSSGRSRPTRLQVFSVIRVESWLVRVEDDRYQKFGPKTSSF
jgi:YgiT-type zinc finger domain-containing protein